MRRRSGRNISGVLLLDKPGGMTSNAALQKARRLFGAAKAGHTGTLDPMATGLLPVCFGEATKFSAMVLDADKAYVARVRLGERTTTGDAEGEIVERRPVHASAGDIDEAVARFVGEIDQIPPMHSALKRDGRPLYEYARAGEEVKREPRRVTIHSASARDFDGTDFTLELRCSKGTYVRTLAEDIGQALGCGAHLVGLRRVATGDFTLDAARDLAALEALDGASREALLHPPDCLVQRLPEVVLPDPEAILFLHGRDVAGGEGSPGPRRVYGVQDGGARRFLGVGEIRPDGRLYPQRVISGGA